MTQGEITRAIIGLMLGFLTAMISTTIVVNALPVIIASLGGSQTDFAWVITAALLATAASTPIWGKLADLFNKKRLVQLTIVIFVSGSVLCGFATEMWMMLTGRVIQGIAVGGLMALSQAIIGSMVSPRERGRYSGYIGATMAVAMSTGPLIGGAIVDSPLGWRWTFFVCVPLAVIALVVLHMTLKLRHVPRPVSIDWWGAITLTSGVCLLLIWVSFAGQDGYYAWLSWQTAAMVGGGLALIVAFVAIEKYAKAPILPLYIVKNRTTALAILASVAVGIVMFASNTFLGQYFQLARGHTPTESGLLLLPLIAGNVIGTISSGQLITRYGRWKVFLVFGGISLTVGSVLAATLNHSTPLWQVGIYIFFIGLGIGNMLQNLVLAVQNTVDVKNIGAASGAVAFFRSFGGAISVAVLGSLLATRVRTSTTEGLAAIGITTPPNAGGSEMDLGSMPENVREIVRAAYGDATGFIFVVCAASALVALGIVLAIKEVRLRTTVKMETSSIPVVSEADASLPEPGEQDSAAREDGRNLDQLDDAAPPPAHTPTR
nr:MFS transporter [Haematomicrobium sanguinis]